MAEDIATLGIEARTRGVQEAARELQQLETQGRRTEGATTSLTGSLSSLGTALTGLGVAAAARQLVSAADEMANIESRIRLVTKSTAELAQVQAELFKRSQESQTSLRANSELYISIARAVDGLGVSQGRLLDLTEGISKSMVVSGTSAEAAGGAIRQLGQALQSGVLRGDEFNSMSENASRLMKALADGLGISRGELRQWAEDGKLTTDVVLPALEKGLRAVDAEYAQMPATVGRATEALRNAFDQWANDVNKQSGLNAALAESVTAIAGNFDLIADSATVAAAAVVGKYVGSLVTATQAKVAETAATMRSAEAEAAVLIVRKEHVAMLLAEAQAASVAAAGMQRLAIVESQVIPLKNQLAAATSAAAAAQSALIPGATLARGALAALGGPIGLVTTALTVGATAWMMWGGNADKATAKAEDVVGKRIDGMIQKLDALNAGLERASRKGFEQAVTAGESELKTVRAEVQFLVNALDQLDSQGGRGRFSEDGKAMQTKLEGFVARQVELEKQLAAARQNSAKVGADALDQYVTKFATAEQKLAKDRAEIVAGYMAVLKQTSADGSFDAKNASHVAALKQLGLAMEEVEKKNKDAAKGLRDANIEAERLKATLMEGFGLQPDFLEDWDRLSKLFASGAFGKGAQAVEALAAAQAKLLEKQPAVRKGTQDQAAADKAAEKILEERTKSVNAAVKAEFDRAQGLKDGAAQMREELATLGMNALQLAAYEASKLRAAAAAEELAASNLEEAASFLAGKPDMEKAVDLYRGLAQARREAAQALRDRSSLTLEVAQKEATINAARDAEEAWRQTAQTIEQSLTDALMRGFEDGKSFAENFRDTLKNLFQTLILRPIIQPVAQGMAGAVMGGLGGAGGGGTDWLGLANSGYSAYGAFSAATNGSAVVGTGMSPFVMTSAPVYEGGTLVSGATYGSAAGAGMGMLGGAYLGYQMTGGHPAGTFAGGALGVAGYGAAAGAMTGAAAGTGAMAGAASGAMAALSAIPVWGWIALAAVALLAGNSGGGTPHLGAATFTDLDDSQRQLKHEEAIGNETVWGGFKGADNLVDPLNTFALGIVKTVEGTLARFGDDRQISAFAAFGADDDDPSRGILRLFDAAGKVIAENTSDGNRHRGVKYDDDPEKGFTEFVSDSGRVIRDALVAADLPGWVDDILTSLGDAPGLALVNQTLAQISALQDVAGNLGPYLGVTAEGLAGIAGSIGGFDALIASLGAFADLSLTAAEKWEITQTGLMEGFDDLGIAVPQSRAEFRKLFESIDLTTDAGQELAAGLLQIAPAFYSVATAVEEAFDAMSISTANLVERFRIDTMTDQEQYAYLDGKIAALDAKIASATDPAELRALLDERNEALATAWSLLSDDQQRAASAQFIDRAMDGEASAQARLSITPIDSAESEAKENERADQAASKTATAVKQGVTEAMVPLLERIANAMDVGNGTSVESAAALREIAASLRGGGYQYSGEEVTFRR